MKTDPAGSLKAGDVELSAVIDGRPLGAFQLRVALLCALALILDAFNSTSIGFVAPRLSALWHLAPAALGPVFAWGFFGQLLGAVIAGPVADRVGRQDRTDRGGNRIRSGCAGHEPGGFAGITTGAARDHRTGSGRRRTQRHCARDRNQPCCAPLPRAGGCVMRHDDRRSLRRSGCGASYIPRYVGHRVEVGVFACPCVLMPSGFSGACLSLLISWCSPATGMPPSPPSCAKSILLCRPPRISSCPKRGSPA